MKPSKFKSIAVSALSLSVIAASGCSAGSTISVPFAADNGQSSSITSAATSEQSNQPSESESETATAAATQAKPESTAATTEKPAAETEKPAQENEWTENKASGEKYVTVGCYSRNKAVIGAETVKLYNVNDKVKIVATTSTGYSKLEDGTFIHNDYLSDTKVVITTAPATNAPSTQKPASTTKKPSTAPSSAEYEWVIKPSYDYDDVEIIREFGDPVGEASLAANQVKHEEGSWTYYEYDSGTQYKGVFSILSNNKYGLIDLNGNVILKNEYDSVSVQWWPSGKHFLTVSYIVDTNIYGNVYSDYWVDESLNPVPTSQGIGGEGYSHFYYDIETGKFFVEYEWIESRPMTSSEINEKYFPVTSAIAYVSGGHSAGIDYPMIEDYSYKTDEAGTGKCGLVSAGRITVPMEYDGFYEAGSGRFFSYDNRIVFFKNNKIYVFDKDGKCYSNGVYDKIDNGNQELYYLNGYLAVCKNGKWGLLDVNGNEAVKCQFEDISSVYDGKAWAKQNGKWGVIKLA